MRIFLGIPIAILAACATPLVNEPSLAPRAAEAIDPRLPIDSAPVAGPVDPAIAARLASLTADGQASASSFDAAVPQAEALANAAGPASSESWIAAQQALSALEAARAGTTKALSDIDAIAAEAIERGGGLGLADQNAVEAASAGLRAITDAQGATIARITARLAR